MSKISNALRKILKSLHLVREKKAVHEVKPAPPLPKPPAMRAVPKPKEVPKPAVKPPEKPLAPAKPAMKPKPPVPEALPKPKPAPPVKPAAVPKPPKPKQEAKPKPKKIVRKKPKRRRGRKVRKRAVKKRIAKKKKEKGVKIKKVPKLMPAEKRRIAVLRGWRTRRKRIKQKLVKMEVRAKRTAATEKRIGKLRGQLIEARKKELELMEREIGEVPVRGEDIMEIGALRETAGRIEREVREQAARMPVSVPAAAYGAPAPGAKLGIDDEIAIVKRMMKALELEFYKRRITEAEFRKGMFEYQQELWELEERKKAIEESRKMPPKPVGVPPAKPEVPAAAPSKAAPQWAAAAAKPAAAPSKAAPPKAAPPVAVPRADLAELQVKTIEELRRLAETMKEDARQRAYAAAAAPPAAMPPAYPAAAAADINERISAARNKIKALEKEFYKRRVPRAEFRKGMFEYQQELRELEAKKKAAEEAEKKPPKPPEKPAVPAAVPAKPPKPVPPRAAPPKAAPAPKAIEKPAAAMPAAKTDLGKIVAKRAAGKVDEERLERLENKMQDIMVRYGIPKKEVERQVRALSSEKILENFSRLIDIIEAQKKVEAEKGPEIKRAPVETIAPGEVLRPKPKPEVIALGIKKRSIVTTFDRALAKVVEGGEVRVGKLAKELDIKKKRLGEVLEVLEDRGLVEIRYPAFGDAVVRIPGYVKPKKAKKKEGKGNKSKVKNRGKEELGGNKGKG